jgi:hypothetical protein
MLKHIFTVLLFITFETEAQIKRHLEIVERLEMPNGPGENGGTVAQNQRNKNIYATIAGNKSYSLAVYNVLNELESPPDLAQLYDIRGLWYHPKLQTFMANSFGNTGWVQYTIDKKGIPYDAKVVFEGQRQPFPQSVGQFSPRENLVYFLKGNVAVAYDANTGNPVPGKNKLLKVGFPKKTPPPGDWKIDSFTVLENYNSTTLIYTGISQSEFGLLNVKNREVELYSAADGLLTTRLKIPEKIPVKDKLNFAYCNHLYWFYDNASRTWAGLR